MKIIRQKWEWISKPNTDFLTTLEKIGRISHKSEGNITDTSAPYFIKQKLINSGHHSVLEHITASVLIYTSRGVSHQLVRHRIASYTQESTRYCNYSKGKFGNEITVILPPRFYDDSTSERYLRWIKCMELMEQTYMDDISAGYSAEEASDVLPKCLKTEIIATLNLRSWINFFKTRCYEDAHPQMRELALSLLKEFKKEIPVIFDNIII